MIAGNIAVKLLKHFPQAGISRVVGKASDAKLPKSLLRPVISGFGRVYDVDLSEAQVPEHGFASFDEFFTRRLHHSSRPVDARNDVLVSPADGRIIDAGVIDPDGHLQIKGQDYTYAELLGCEAERLDLAGGSFSVVYLSPRDYHRVHSPADARVLGWWRVSGTRFPVNALGMRFVSKLFARNERVVVSLRHPELGPFYLVMVAAAGVGNIELCFDQSCRRADQNERRYTEQEACILSKGEELGVFHLGSTVVVLSPKQSRLKSAAQAGERIKMGQVLSCRSKDEQ